MATVEIDNGLRLGRNICRRFSRRDHESVEPDWTLGATVVQLLQTLLQLAVVWGVVQTWRANKQTSYIKEKKED